jgi:transposase-like protein
MTELSVTLAEYLRKIDVDLDGDFLREGMRLLAQLIMEGEVSEQIGATKHQRTA